MKITAISLALTALMLSCAPERNTVLVWAVGKDPTGQHQAMLSQFEKTHPGITVKLLELPESSSAQHDAFVTYLASGDGSVDVYSIDIIWPAEFASAGWLRPLDNYWTADDLDEFLPGPVRGCRFRDSLYAIPWFTDAGMLFYRRDILKKHGRKVPATWDELIREAAVLSQAEGMAGYVWQGQQYEGLVCNFLEILWSCGGEIVDGSGRARLDQPEASEALKIMKALVSSGASPGGVLTYKEEEARQAFTSGQAIFMRNWPYAWALAQDTAKGSLVAGKVGMAPLPALPGQVSAACLGGWNLAVSRFSRHPGEAVELIRFLTSSAGQREFALKGGRLPTRRAVYQDSLVLKVLPQYRDFYQAFVTARPRPAGPEYSMISDVLQLGLHSTLAGGIATETALEDMQGKINRITADIDSNKH